jgi:hypothetical protein
VLAIPDTLNLDPRLKEPVQLIKQGFSLGVVEILSFTFPFTIRILCLCYEILLVEFLCAREKRNALSRLWFKALRGNGAQMDSVQSSVVKEGCYWLTASWLLVDYCP